MENNPTTTATATLEMPRLGGYAAMQRLTGRSRVTIYKWVWRGKLRPGVYVGNGLFNISWVNEILDNHDTIFLKRG